MEDLVGVSSVCPLAPAPDFTEPEAYLEFETEEQATHCKLKYWDIKRW